MLLLDRPLLGRFDGVEVRPVLETDVRRDEGAEPPPVAPVLLVGETARSGDITGGLFALPRSSVGISGVAIVNFCDACTLAMVTNHPQPCLSRGYIARMVSLAR